MQELLDWGKRLLTKELAGTGVTAHPEVIHGYAADILTRRSTHADLLVLGAHGSTALPHLLLGSTAYHCARRAHCPTMIVHAPPAEAATSFPEVPEAGAPMDVNEVLLRGVGLRYEFVNADGDRIGIVAHRRGDFDLVTYRDPAESVPLFRLTAAEADAVAEILGAPRIAERFADLTREVPGLHSGQIAIPATSPHAGQPLSHTRARTRTGASTVAVVGGEQVIASPTPAEVLRPGDILVVIGTDTGITGVRDIIQGRACTPR